MGVVFTSAEVGFIAAVGNVHFGGETSVIRRTTDGGGTWQPIWTGRDLALSWIGRAGANLVAFGERSPQTQADNASLLPDGQPVPDQAVVVTSTDGGSRWSVAGATALPIEQHEVFVAAFATTTTGIEVPDPASNQYLNAPAEMLRTTDGGRTWDSVTLPGGVPTGGATFTSPTTGFVTGYRTPVSQGYEGELWKTTDAGQTWTALPASREPFALDGVTFPTPSVGYAVGGPKYGDGSINSNAVIATGDGGTTWSVRYTGPRIPHSGQLFSVPAFPNVNDGYVLAATCTGSGGEGACDGTLWATTDSGHTWTPTRRSGARLSAPAPGHPYVVDGMV